MAATKTKTKSKVQIKTKTIVAVAVVAGALAVASAGVVAAANKPVLIAGTSTPPVSGQHVKGASDVDMYGFTMRANRNFDLVVDRLLFTVIADDDADLSVVDNDVVAQDHITSCVLVNDQSGAVVAGPVPVDSAGQVEFLDQFTLPSKVTEKFVVRCDLANIDPANSTPDIYAFTLTHPAHMRAHHAVNGNNVPRRLKRSLDGNAGLNPSGGLVNQTVISGGTLTVSLDSSSPGPGNVSGGESDVVTAVYKFEASGEDVTVTELTLHNCITQPGYEAYDCPAPSAIGDDQAIRTVMLTYTNSQGMQALHNGFLTGNTALFFGLDLLVPDGGSELLTVQVDVSDVGPIGATAGDQFQLNLAADDLSVRFEAIGESSGSQIDSGDLNTYVAAKMFTLAGTTQPTVTLAVGSPSGGGFVPAMGEVFRFNVSADSGGDLSVDQYTFSITSTDGAGSGWNTCANWANPSNFEIYNVLDPSTALSGANVNFYSAGGIDCSLDPTGVVRYWSVESTFGLIGAGSTETFVVYADTTGASSSADDAIRVDIPLEGSAPSTVLYWVDDATGTVHDGTGINALPVNGGTIVY